MDDDVRRLERAAESDPAQALELARVLERAGRPRAAERALRRGVADSAVRSELVARRPSWWGERGPGSCNWLDVPPLAEAPRVRWRVSLPQFPPLFPRVEGAGPLGILVSTPLGFPAFALDPETGTTRWQAEGNPQARPEWIDGDRVLLRGYGRGVVRALDAWDGSPVWAWPREKELLPAGWAVSLSMRSGDARVSQLDPRVSDAAPVEALAGDRVVIVPQTGGLRTTTASAHQALFDSRGLLYLTAYREPDWGFLTLDPITLDVLGEGVGMPGMADQNGAVVLFDQAPFTYLDGRGVEVWRMAALGSPSLMTPSHILVWTPGGPDEWSPGSFLCVERATGRVRGELDLPAGHLQCGAGDVVYLTTVEEVVALGLDGRERWRVHAADLGPATGEVTIEGLVPMSWAVVVSRSDGLFVCLEEADEERTGHS